MPALRSQAEFLVRNVPPLYELHVRHTLTSYIYVQIGGVVPMESSTPGENCSICLEALHDDVVKIVACRHEFHLVCVLAWFQSDAAHSSCPNCRTELYEPEPESLRAAAPILEYGGALLEPYSSISVIEGIPPPLYDPSLSRSSRITRPHRQATTSGATGAFSRNHASGSYGQNDDENAYAVHNPRLRPEYPESDSDSDETFGPPLRRVPRPTGFSSRQSAQVPGFSSLLILPPQRSSAAQSPRTRRIEGMRRSLRANDLPRATRRPDFRSSDPFLLGGSRSETNTYFDPQRLPRRSRSPSSRDFAGSYPELRFGGSTQGFSSQAYQPSSPRTFLNRGVPPHIPVPESMSPVYSPPSPTMAPWSPSYPPRSSNFNPSNSPTRILASNHAPNQGLGVTSSSELPDLPGSGAFSPTYRPSSPAYDPAPPPNNPTSPRVHRTSEVNGDNRCCPVCGPFDNFPPRYSDASLDFQSSPTIERTSLAPAAPALAPVSRDRSLARRRTPW